MRSIQKIAAYSQEQLRAAKPDIESLHARFGRQAAISQIEARHPGALRASEADWAMTFDHSVPWPGPAQEMSWEEGKVYAARAQAAYLNSPAAAANRSANALADKIRREFEAAQRAAGNGATG